MTTLKDYLRDLAQEVLEISRQDEEPEKTTEEVESKIDEYIDLIKERLIG